MHSGLLQQIAQMEVNDRKGTNCIIKKHIQTSKPMQEETGQEMFICIRDTCKGGRPLIMKTSITQAQTRIIIIKRLWKVMSGSKIKLFPYEFAEQSCRPDISLERSTTKYDMHGK